MLKWLRKILEKRRESVQCERAIVVSDADGVITATYPNGDRLCVAWDDLTAIEVHTNDSGPWGTDVWWVLRDSDGTCMYPQGATGDAEMIPKYQTLAGFKDDELIRAMGCTDNRQFLCWARARAASQETHPE